MDVTILAVASKVNRVAGILETEEVQTTHAAFGAGHDTNSHGVFGLFVDNNVVAASQWETLDVVARQVLVVGKEDGGFGRLDVKKLGKTHSQQSNVRLIARKVILPSSCRRFECHVPQARCQ